MKMKKEVSKPKNKIKKECRWCYGDFTPKNINDICCCRYCTSKYYQYLANDEAQKPWDKFVNQYKFD